MLEIFSMNCVNLYKERYEEKKDALNKKDIKNLTTQN